MASAFSGYINGDKEHSRNLREKVLEENDRELQISVTTFLVYLIVSIEQLSVRQT